MKRSNFLKLGLYGSAAATLLPITAFKPLQKVYTLDQLIGKNNPDIEGDSYTSKMHKDTKVAFEAMQKAAANDGIAIEVVSAYRSFNRQKEIFEAKYSDYISKGLAPLEAIRKIIEYSTIPGTSRHHWGTDLDLIDANAPRPENLLLAEHFHGEGPFCRLKEWMDLHSESFGFYEVYTDDPYREGFKYEPWHFSFAPIARPMLKEYRSLNIKDILEAENIKGAEHFTDDFIYDYRNKNILDINPELL